MGDVERTESEPGSPEALIREARELRRRRRRRTGAAILIGLATLGGGGIALVGGGGAPPAPALSGPLPSGIAARAADPAGGLAWGLRVVHATGWTCVQLGRLHGASLGLLGRDGSFGDDGRFHPFGPSTTNQSFCAQNDGRGHAFLSVQRGAQPTSGQGAGFGTPMQCRPDHQLVGMQAQVECPERDLRFVQYGLLGPDATSITYTFGGRSEVEQTHGPDGAYLVVAQTSPSLCARFDRNGLCGESGSSDRPQIFGGIITAVHYRDGRACRLARSYPDEPVFRVTCPLVGYVPPRLGIRESQVAAPVSVRLIKANQYCFTRTDRLFSSGGRALRTDIGPYLPCDGPVPAGEIRDPLHAKGSVIVFTWTARLPVTSATSRYDFSIQLPCGGGSGASTVGRIHVGERLTRGMFESSRCTGTFTGEVDYDPNVGPGGYTTSRILPPGFNITHRPGQNLPILVGRFRITIH